MKRANTSILVTVIAVLIWAFAEGESLQTRSAVAEVTFLPLVAGVWATEVADPAWTGRVEIQVQGPTAGLDTLETALQGPLEFEPGATGLPRLDGDHTIDVRELLRAHPAFADRGVTVVVANPNSTRVRVEELATVSLPIQIDAPVAELDGLPELVNVTSARVRVPIAIAQNLPEDASLVATVTLDDLAGIPEGIQSDIRVRLTPGPGLEGVRLRDLEPAQVDVRVTFRAKTASVVLPSVPVDLRLPSGEVGKWNVEIPTEDRIIENVTVIGPSDLIEEIDARTRPVFAYLRLSSDDLLAGATSKPAEFSLYPTPLTFEAEDLNIQFRITPREPPPSE